MRTVLSLSVLLMAGVLVAAEPATAPVKTPATAPTTGPATAPSSIGADLLRDLTSDTGSMAVQVVQGTAGGASVVGLPVTVELVPFGKSNAERTVLEARVDAHGIAMLEELSLSTAFIPTIWVEFGGIPFQVQGTVPMHAGNPEMTFTVTVYESTDKAPAWEIASREVMLAPSPHGKLYVTETLKVNNPTDRAWLAPADASGMRASFVLPLPPGAEVAKGEDGKYLGLRGVWGDEGSATVRGNKIYYVHELFPGESSFTVQYTLPSGEQGATVDIVAPAPVKQMMALVPHSGGVKAQAKGMVQGQVVVHPNQPRKPLQTFKAVDLAAGATVSLTISSPAMAAEGVDEGVGEEVSDETDYIQTAGITIIVIGVVVFLIGLRRKAIKADQG